MCDEHSKCVCGLNNIEDNEDVRECTCSKVVDSEARLKSDEEWMGNKEVIPNIFKKFQNFYVKRKQQMVLEDNMYSVVKLF
jgi:hypothetical protein